MLLMDAFCGSGGDEGLWQPGRNSIQAPLGA